MNEQQRNEVITSNEHATLNAYLNDRESLDLCEDCLINDVYIEWDDKYICQICYESYCEQAEYLADLQEDR